MHIVHDGSYSLSSFRGKQNCLMRHVTPSTVRAKIVASLGAVAGCCGCGLSSTL